MAVRRTLLALLLSGAAGCSEVRLASLEACNGLDDDGDGVVDEGFDGDGDGWTSCPSTGQPGDCDDARAGTYPGAPESCDGRDDDCDGTLPLPEADADGDGVRACAGDCDDGDPSANLSDDDHDGWTTCAGDCDDADPSRSPAGPLGCEETS